ncbi:hypothetical protein [Microcoleus sp. OTE_8_concoct_300]|uniref:hypothetical protein n=1 Tax=Microcoleus sp. OTE_8_concoct_300 TaxID=2964710 RepID=UPI00403FAED0
MKNSFILSRTKILSIFLLVIFSFFVVGTQVNSQAVECQNKDSYIFRLGRDEYSLTLVIKDTSQGCQILADGKDYATITAQLSKHAKPGQPIKVHLQEGGIGELNATDLIIQENTQNSKNYARLTSKIAGQSIVNYQALLPGGTWLSGKSIKINFVEPLKISLAASPPKNMFLGSLIRCGITASLTDNNNKFKNSNEERRINLSIVNGHGTFLQDGKHYNNVTLVIPSGQSSASIDFVPNLAGNVTIKADSSSMESVTTEVDFWSPLLPITIAGIVGSVMALLNNSTKRNRENQKSWKVILLLGVISGIVFSIFSLFLASLNPSFDQSWAFLIALISSLIGGWFGPERIFEPILNRLTGSNQPTR